MGGVALAAVFKVGGSEGLWLFIVDGGKRIGLTFGIVDGEKLFCVCDKLGGKIGG